MPALVEADVAAARELDELLSRDATAYAKGLLGIVPWRKQREILESVRDHKRTLVVSANGVGKTNIGACALIQIMGTKADCGAVVSSTTLPQAKDVQWAEVKRLYDRAAERGFPLGGRLLDTKWTMPDGSQAVVQNPRNPVAVHGRHRAFMFVLLDEAAGIPADHIDAYDSTMAGGDGRLLANVNPLFASGWCFEAARRPDIWNVIYVSALDHPNVITGREVIPRAVTRAWCEEKLREWGADHPLYQARVLGRFPDAATDQLVSLAWLDAAEKGTSGVDVEPSMGVDVARSLEGDFSVCHVLDRTRRTVAVEKWRSNDLVYTAGRVRQVAERFKVPAHRVGIDVCGGYGGSVLDSLKAAGFRAVPVDFSSTTRLGHWDSLVGKDVKFKNVRAELHWAGRELLRRQLASIGREHGGTWTDITTPIWWSDPAGRICIEAKDDIKERLGRSPDEGDAFFLALGVHRRALDTTVYRSK